MSQESQDELAQITSFIESKIKQSEKQQQFAKKIDMLKLEYRESFDDMLHRYTSSVQRCISEHHLELETRRSKDAQGQRECIDFIQACAEHQRTVRDAATNLNSYILNIETTAKNWVVHYETFLSIIRRLEVAWPNLARME